MVKQKGEILILKVGTEKIHRGSYRGGLWHGSQVEKIANHGSRISKSHFPESRT